MVEARELRAAATEYTEADYQLSKIVDEEIPLDWDMRALFFVDMDRREERVRARSSCKELDEGVSITGLMTQPSNPIDLTADQADATKASGPSVTVQDDGGVDIRGPLLPTGHLRKLVRLQGQRAQRPFQKYHAQLDRLSELIQSHLNIKNELPEAPDDIMEMLVEQAKSIEELHEKLCSVGRMLGAEQYDSESKEDDGYIEGESLEDDELIEEGLIGGGFIEYDSSQYEDEDV